MLDIQTYEYRYDYDKNEWYQERTYSLVKSDDPVVEIVLNGQGQGPLYIFSDNVIDGENYFFKLSHHGLHYDGANIYIKLYSLSESYYLYLKSFYQQVEAEKDFFSEPVQVYGNIEGGRGIFAGYNVSVDSCYIEWPSSNSKD